MRFLHTADWQIGMKAAHVGAAAEKVRQARLTAAERVVSLAREHEAAFILVAGDTFEDNAVDRVLVQRVADILAGFQRPVYLIAGNHDPLVPGSVWEHAAWDQPNLHVLRDDSPLDVDGAILHPAPLTEKYSTSDPTARIAANGGAINLGLAHGAVRGLAQDCLNFPIDRDAARRAGLDYLALGDWHSFGSFPDEDGAARMAYSGTHEQTRFGERDSGNVLIVEIERRGAPPRISPLRSGSLSWFTETAELREEGDAARLLQRLEQMEGAGQSLLDLRLEGVLCPGDWDALARLRELAEARFLYARIDDTGLLPSPGDDRWISEVPLGLLREAAERLRQWSDPHFAGPRPEAASPEVAARALLQLYRLTREEAA
jgi:DNA repair exonuclease SbcCD nuclease subunit